MKFEYPWVDYRNCGLLLMWFILLASIDVIVNKSHVRTGLGKAFWTVDRFVAVFNLGGQSAS